MLVLTRKLNEKIRIGSSIVITVVRVKGNAVRLGIEAPADINILRGELAFDRPTDDAQPERVHGKATIGEPADEPSPCSEASQPITTNARRKSTNHWPVKKPDDRAASSPVAGMDAGVSRPLTKMVGARNI